MARPERTPIVNGINKDDKAAAILETCLLDVLGGVKENDENQNEKKKKGYLSVVWKQVVCRMWNGGRVENIQCHEFYKPPPGSRRFALHHLSAD